MLIGDEDNLEHEQDLMERAVWTYHYMYGDNWHRLRFTCNRRDEPEVGDQIKNNRLVKGGGVVKWKDTD